jgi:hypothetical protein
MPEPVTPQAPTSPPPFMAGVIDPTEEQIKASDVLSGDDPGSEENQNQEVDENGKPVETPKVGEDGKPIETIIPEVDENGKPVETPKVDENGKPVETPKVDVNGKPIETPKVDENGKPVVEDPKKTPEEIAAESAGKAIDTAAQDAEKADKEELNRLVSRPLVNFEAPDPANYQGKDGFDLKGYLGDTLKAFTLELQKSMAGGGMAAIQFKVLKKALQSESQERITESTRQENAKVIWDGVTTKFPILRDENSAVTKSFIRAVYGEKQIRLAEAQKAGKQPEDLKLEDYIELAKDVLKDSKSSTEKPTVPVENMPGGPALQDGGQKKDGASKDIDDMMNFKKRSGSIF